MNPCVQNPPWLPAVQSLPRNRARSQSLKPGRKPYNQSHMQTASSARLRDGSMAARRHGAEKPHQGVSTRNRASHRGFARCKSNTALGLRAGCAGNRVRSFCSGEQFDPDLSLYYLRARYYNAATGRFLSRDPEDGKAIDPKTLHKYLYVGGDPVNWIDPTGRDMFETGLVLDKIAVATTWSVARLGVEVALCYYGIYEMLEHGINWVSGPVTAVICAMPFVPHPPAPPGPPPPVPPPPPPEPPPPCFDLNCWNPPPGTPIN